MTQLRPDLAQRVLPIQQKWDGFVGKVQQRVQDVLAEAHAGVDQLIAQYPTDPGPMGTAMTAVQTRFHGLDSKVDESWSKIEEEYDEVLDEDDLPFKDWEALSALKDEMHKKYEELREHIELQYHWLEMRKQADWGRRLWDIMQQEIQQPIGCSQCGAPFQNTTYWISTNMACPHCGSMNAVHPGAASGLFYQGLGIHSLSHEQAWNEWMAEQAAKKFYDGRRHQTAADHQHWIQAAQAYWTKYYETTRQMNPGFTQPVAEAVANRIGQYTSFEQPLERIKREFFQNLCQAAAQRNPAALHPLLQNLPATVDLDECAECLVEHGDSAGAVTVLEYTHRAQGEDEPLQRWVKERMKEIKQTLDR